MDHLDKTKMTFPGRLRTDDVLIGTFVHIASPELVEIVGHAGFDFVIIDTEHGPFGMETAVNLVRAADAAGIYSVVRVADNRASEICKALDTGADGVLIPQIGSEAGARAAVQAAKYHPKGQRGVFPYMRGADYSAEAGKDFYQRANLETAVILLVEGSAGVDNLSRILSVPDVDSIFIGPMDLSQSVGFPGQVDHPAVQEQLQTIIGQAAKKGIAAGIYDFDVTRSRQWMEMGIGFVAFYTDSAIIYEAYQKISESLRTSGDL
jgi:4-hydroxy-2-oxoheptanedioate aldolase